MTATVKIVEANGLTPTFTEVTSSRYCTTDSYAPGTLNPIPIPSAGSFNRSYWKSHCLDLSGTYTDISNIRFFTDGSINWTLGTSGGVYVATKSSGDSGLPQANYTQATGTEGVSGDDMMSSITYYSGGTKQLVSNYTDLNPLLIDSTHYSGAVKTKFVVTQVWVDDDATHGAQPAEQYTFMWDEV